MNKTSFMLFIISVLLNCSDKTSNDESSEISEERWNEYYNTIGTELDKDSKEWQLNLFISPEDSGKMIMVSYSDELGLKNKTIYCKVLWKSKKTGDYKCTAPWINGHKLIKSNNILDLDIEIINMDSIPLKLKPFENF